MTTKELLIFKKMQSLKRTQQEIINLIITITNSKLTTEQKNYILEPLSSLQLTISCDLQLLSNNFVNIRTKNLTIEDLLKLSEL